MTAVCLARELFFAASQITETPGGASENAMFGARFAVIAKRTNADVWYREKFPPCGRYNDAMSNPEKYLRPEVAQQVARLDLRAKSIVDLPGLHSRDQVPGSWTLPDAPVGDQAVYAPYLRALAARQKKYREAPGRLLFSGACALELEGCGRLDWVHRGVSSLRRLLGS